MRKYTKSYDIANWIVTKESLEKVYKLFVKRFPTPNNSIDITLKFGPNGEEEEHFPSSKKLDKCIETEIIENKKNIYSLIITGHSRTLKNGNFPKHTWIEISFKFCEARFNSIVYGNDKDKDWLYGFLDDISTLIKSFAPERDVLDFIKKDRVDKYKYKSSVIEFDYNGLIQKQVADKINNTGINLQGSQFHFGIGDNIGGHKIDILKKDNKRWWETSLIQLVFLVGAIAGIIGLYLYFHK